MQSPIDAAIAIQSDFNSPSLVRDTPKPSTSTKPTACQCQDATNSRRAYIRLNKKYKTVMRKVRVLGFRFIYVLDKILISLVTLY